MIDPIKVTTCVVKREKREISPSLDYFYMVIPTCNPTTLSLLHLSCLRQLTKVPPVLALSMDLCQLTKLGEFVYGARGGSSPNNGEGARGDGEAGSKAQGQVVEAGREGGLRGPMENDEANVVMDVENMASVPTMSNLEDGMESSPLAPSQVCCPSNNNSPSLKLL